MGLIERLGTILQSSIEDYNNIQAGKFSTLEKLGDGDNILALGDNNKFMAYLLSDNENSESLKGKVQCIYIDPPFFSKANYEAVITLPEGDKDTKKLKHKAYEDIWEQGKEQYLKELCTKLMLMRDLLSDTGTIWLHLDWHISHYVKVFLDEIFGEKNFINEIVWTYKSGGSSKRHFARKHDTILVYGKTKNYYLDLPKEKSYNRGLKPYRFKGVEEFCDDVGWYTLVKMKDVWNIDMVGRTSSERTGYATQKPEALLKRIIEASSKEGDIVCDFFCGSGTTAAAAGKLNRRWVCCDLGMLAIASSYKRLFKQAEAFTLLREKGINSFVEGDSLAKFEFSLEETLLPRKAILKINLRDYFLDMGKKNYGTKVQEHVNNVGKEHMIDLVDYWSVDYDYKKDVYRPDEIFSCEKGIIAQSITKEIDYAKGEKHLIALKVIDVFGNSYFTVVDLDKL